MRLNIFNDTSNIRADLIMEMEAAYTKFLTTLTEKKITKFTDFCKKSWSSLNQLVSAVDDNQHNPAPGGNIPGSSKARKS